MPPSNSSPRPRNPSAMAARSPAPAPAPSAGRPTPAPGPLGAPVPAAAALTAAADQLDQTLRELLAAHEELLTLAAAHRSAISRADVRALADVLAAQGAVTERIVELERQRQAAVAGMIRHAGLTGPTSGFTQGPGAARTTLSQLVRAISDPARSRLLAVADRLREVLNRLHAEHMALREAAESLSDHMEGLMRQVCRKLSHAGTYARSGVIDTSAPVVTALDIRS